MQTTIAVGAAGNRRVWATALSTLIFAFSLSSCKVTSEDIDYWKGTVKGPGKIVAVILADKYSMELRTDAALALVDMERPDRDGTAELQQALTRLDETERAELVQGMVPGLEELMKRVESDAPGGAPSARQTRAKDAAFVLITHAPPEVRAKLTRDVVDWYMQDFNGRSLAGNYSAEQVVRSLGTPAAAELAKGLNARMPQQALVKMAELVGQLADAPSRADAAKRLVAIQAEMEGQEFLDWVKQNVKEQAAQSNLELDAAKLTRVAEANRDNFINDGALPAMKWLASEPVVKQRLLQLASGDLPGEAGKLRRVRALQALEGKVDAGDLDQLLKLSLDSGNPTEVRDYAFDRVGDIKSPAALPSLWPLVGGTSNDRLRWRAGELVLAIGGPAIVPEFFRRLPRGAKYAAEELEGYATRMGQMTPLPVDALRGQLTSTEWFSRVIAIRFFERKGTRADLAKLEALKSDQAAVEGEHWGKKKTVADVAKEALTAATQRLSQSESP